MPSPVGVGVVRWGKASVALERSHLEINGMALSSSTPGQGQSLLSVLLESFKCTDFLLGEEWACDGPVESIEVSKNTASEVVE